MAKWIQVRALRDGHYGGRYREAGDVFPVPAGQKLGSWMQRVSDPPPQKADPSTVKPDAAAVLAAVQGLDPDRDDHWTKDGLPAMEAVEAALGVRASVLTRDDVDAAAPDFRRPPAAPGPA